MSIRALAIRFQSEGPAQAGKYVKSLYESLNEVAEPAASDQPSGSTLAMQLAAANPEAQGLDTALIIHSLVDGALAGVIVGVLHVATEPVGTKIAKSTLIKLILNWWNRNGRPPMEIETDSHEIGVLTATTLDPEKVLISVVDKFST